MILSVAFYDSLFLFDILHTPQIIPSTNSKAITPETSPAMNTPADKPTLEASESASNPLV